jgi:hypothetical protein
MVCFNKTSISTGPNLRIAVPGCYWSVLYISTVLLWFRLVELNLHLMVRRCRCFLDTQMLQQWCHFLFCSICNDMVPLLIVIEMWRYWGTIWSRNQQFQVWSWHKIYSSRSYLLSYLPAYWSNLLLAYQLYYGNLTHIIETRYSIKLDSYKPTL